MSRDAAGRGRVAAQMWRQMMAGSSFYMLAPETGNASLPRVRYKNATAVDVRRFDTAATEMNSTA